jgi:hypothetical protein
MSWVTNGVSSYEHASRQQRLATSWEYQRESVICCVTFAQYTSLLEFGVPSLEFHCVLWFFYILLNKTPWDQRRKNSFGLRTFRVTNGLHERIKFVNRGSTVFVFFLNMYLPKFGSSHYPRAKIQVPDHNLCFQPGKMRWHTLWLHNIN